MILILETQTLKHREIKWLAGIIQLIMASTAKNGSNLIVKKRYIQKKPHKGQCQKWGPSCSVHSTTLLWGIPLSYFHEYQEWQVGRRSCGEVSLHLSLNAGSLPIFFKGKTQVVKKLPLMPQLEVMFCILSRRDHQWRQIHSTVIYGELL